MIKLNRIGNKLGLAGAVGILLAIGMAANQMIAELSVTGSTDRANRSQRVADAALTAHLDLRMMQLAARDIRLARTAAEVEKSTADLQRLKVAGVKALDDALAAAQRPEVRERLQNTKSLLDRYTAGVEELAKAQNTLLAQTDKRSVISAEWTKAVEAELASPLMAKLDNKAEIEKLLYRADVKVNELRAMAWQLGATGEASLIASMAKTQSGLKAIFNLLRGEADDRRLLEVISSLDSIVKRFLAANDEVVKTEQLKNDIVVNRTVNVATEAVELMETTVDTAQKNSMASKNEVVAETAQANRINLTMAVIVILSLVGSMVFSFIGITRPMMRLNSALGKMAGGNLDVVIPGTGRGDEIGDLAKTVTVIRENAEQKARDEAEAKAKQDQIARQAAQGRHDQARRRTSKVRSARSSQTVSSASTRARSLGRHADDDRRARAGAHHRGGRGFRRGLHQCAVGGLRNRGAVLVGQRDQPPGAGIGADGERRRRPGAHHQRPGQRTVEGRQPYRRRGRTDQHHRRPDQPAGAQRHHRGGARRRGRPRLCGGRFRSEGSWPSRPRRRPARSASRSPASRPRRRSRWARSRKSASTIEKLSEISSTIAAAVEEQGAATQEISRNVQQAAHGTQQVSANITDVQRGAAETGSASSQVLSAAQSLSGDSSRLKTEVGRFLELVRAA